MEKSIFNNLVSQFETQKEFCQAVGISEPLCSNYMTGKKKPKIETISKYAKKLGYDLFIEIKPINHLVNSK